MPTWIDTHCHLDARELAADVDGMRAAARAAGVGHCVIPAVAVGNFDAVRELAHRFGDSYALGIHPLCTGDAGDGDIARLDQALHAFRDDPRLVAVGEIGLDYFVPGLDGPKQEHLYREQLKLARKHGLPVILHVRRSADKLLKELRRIEVKGIGHAFNGSGQQAAEFLKLGFKLGFGGTVTYERSLQIRRLALELPLDAIVLETDSPDIPPHWLYRTAEERAAGATQAVNTPAELPGIGEVLAGLRGMGVLGIHQILILVYDPRSHSILRYRCVDPLLCWTMLIPQVCSTTTNSTLLEDGIWFLIV
ncbi:MAG: TatD family deoxyribonuclease, partial [Comamonadaceae bacterium]